MENLASHLGGLGEHDQAAVLQKQTVEARKRTLGEKHPIMLQSMTGLARIYRRMGPMEECAETLEEVLGSKEEVLEEDVSLRTDRL